MDPGIRDRGLCQPLPSLTWLSKAHGLHSHRGWWLCQHDPHDGTSAAVSWFGPSQILCLLGRGRRRHPQKTAGAPQTTKDAMLVFKLGKILKDGMSMESQQVSAASISVPVSGARPGKAHHTRGLVTSCFTVYSLTVLSSRCQWQHIPLPASTHTPSWLGQALPSFLFPGFITSDTGLTLCGSTKGISPPKRAQMQIHDFHFLKRPVSSIPTGYHSLVTWYLTMHWCTNPMAKRTGLCFPKAAVLSSEVIRWSLMEMGNTTPGCALGCYSRIFQQQIAKEVQEKDKRIQQLPVLAHMKWTCY